MVLQRLATREIRSSELRQSSRGGKRKKDRSTKDKSVTDTGEKLIKQYIFAGNEYVGTIGEDPHNIRTLDTSVGKYVWPNQTKYEGPLVNSQIVGKGKFTWPDGSWYEGELLNGKRHGHGVYTAADLITCYDGQWNNGTRHGHGKLSYEKDAHYDGQWVDGAKHGSGRQVWPSGNVYEGEWRLGHMVGEGRMTWIDGGVFEQFEGTFVADRAHGHGTHIWHAASVPKPATDPTSRDMPSQQMNNAYSGQWVQGVRHGRGKFSYASGATYDGEWENNTKEGLGRYCFADGRIYDGPFQNDAFKNRGHTPGSESSASLRVLNIGSEDNPVRRCVDISDLNPFCLPVDVGPHDFDIGSGYDEDHEVMREVFNMLLRYLGEIKKIYGIYRLFLTQEADDPFILSSPQFWLFCRDFDLATPSCSLSLLNRIAFAGPRHHAEVAHADFEDIRPITPRPFIFDEVSAATSEDSEGDWDTSPRTSAIENGLLGSDADGLSQAVDEATTQGGTHREDGEDSQFLDEEEEEQEIVRYANQYVPRDVVYAARRAGLEGWLPSKFWRHERETTDIHSPGRKIMVRHFLEHIVRMSIARFPNEKGLEHQVRRMFKEKLLPSLSGDLFATGQKSQLCFHAIMDRDVQRVFEERQQTVGQLFQNNFPGEGCGYAQAPWSLVAAQFYPGILFSDDNLLEDDKVCEEMAPFATIDGIPIVRTEVPVIMALQHESSVDESLTDSFSKKESAEVKPDIDETRRGSLKSATQETTGGEDEMGECAEGQQEEVLDDAVQDGEAEVERKSLRPPAIQGRGRRGWGGSHRRSHVAARWDLTIRVKDVFRIVDSAGFLTPLQDTWGRTQPAVEEQIADSKEENSDSENGGECDAFAGLGNAMQLPCGTNPETNAETLGEIVPEPGVLDKLMELQGPVLPEPPEEPPELPPEAPPTPTGSNRGGQSKCDFVEGYPPATPTPETKTLTQTPSSVLTPQRASTADGVSNRRASEESKRSIFSACGDDPASLSKRSFFQSGQNPIASVSERSTEGATGSGGQQTTGGSFNVEPIPLSSEEIFKDIADTEFKVNFIDIVAVLTEVLCPKSLQRIHWSVPVGTPDQDELIALLDYMEMQVTRVEFQRFLVRFVEIRTSGPDRIVSTAPIHQRLTAFLDAHFLPALETPYKKQVSETRENLVLSFSAMQPSQSPSFWRGFVSDVVSLSIGSLAAESHAPRFWPKGYVQEVADW